MNFTESSLITLQDHIIARQRTAERPFLEIRDISYLRHTLFSMLSENPNILEQPSPFIVEAANFAEKALDGKFHTKGSHNGEKVPNVIHAYRVAIRLAEIGITNNIAIATALLHDVLEKTPIIKEEIAEKFGQEVAQNVFALSINFNEGVKIPAKDYWDGIIGGSLATKQVKAADRIDNLFSYFIMPLDAPMKHRKSVRERFSEDLDETQDQFRYIDTKSLYLDGMLARVVHRGYRILEADRKSRTMLQTGRRKHKLAS